MAAKYTDAAAARNHGAPPTIGGGILIAAMKIACGNMYPVTVFVSPCLLPIEVAKKALAG